MDVCKLSSTLVYFINENSINIIYYNKNSTENDEKAFTYFDKIVKKDPKSSEAKGALENIKKIFEAKKDITGLEEYFKTIYYLKR